jgi:hypothetical protein
MEIVNFEPLARPRKIRSRGFMIIREDSVIAVFVLEELLFN